MEYILITGAGGFVGKHLVDAIASSGQLTRLVATARKPAGATESDVVYHEMDITSLAHVERLFDLEKPSVIVHAAALSKPDECELNKEKAFLVNTVSVKHLLQAAAKTKSHFIFLSTDFVFDGAKGMYAEEDVPSPVNYYGETKLQAEELVKQYPYGWCILRAVLVYGPSEGTRENILTSSAKTLLRGEGLRIVNDQVRTPTYVGDLCKAITAVIRKKANGIFHISGKDVMTPFEMVTATANYLGLDENLVTPVTQDNFNQPAKRPLKTGFDISKARKELDYEPLSFREGLIKTFASGIGNS